MAEKKKPKDDNRDIFEKVLDVARDHPKTTGAIVGGLAGGLVGRAGFRGIGLRHGGPAEQKAAGRAGALYGGVPYAAGGYGIGDLYKKKHRAKRK